MNREKLTENLAWGVRWGLRFGIGFSLIALVPALIRVVMGAGEWWQRGLSFGGLIGLYLVTGLVGGVTVVAMRGLAGSWLGRRLIGAIVGVQFMFAVRLLIYGWEGWNREELTVWLVIGSCWGMMMSFIPEHDVRTAQAEARAQAQARANHGP